MTKPKILLQLDTDLHPSTFDSVVAIDSGIDQLIRLGSVSPENVQGLVHGAMFTRGVPDLRSTAIFIGGSHVARGESLMAAVRACFFGPMRVSVMMDANGANTTAAAAVLAAARHIELKGARAAVLAATGPVGMRVVRLLASEGVSVRAASRSIARASETCRHVAHDFPKAELTPWEAGDDEQIGPLLEDVDVLIAAGAAGVQLVSSIQLQNSTVKVAIDLNAVPPVGIQGIESTDKGSERNGRIVYGAIGVGGAKMKIHQESLRKLFTANDLVLDSAEIYELGKQVELAS